jgi:hypothetical protein
MKSVRTAVAAVIAIAASATSASFAADANSLAGIHWWGYYDYNVIDSAPAQILDSQQLVNGVPYGGWDMEIINTHGPEWQNAPFFQPLYADLYANKKITPITRIEYEYGKTVPSPATINSQTWANNHVVPLINTLKDSAHWWQLGNEPNIIGEGTDWANGQVTPAGYAQVYKDVRNSIAATAQVGLPGGHKLMIAPVSPGGVIPGVRWMSGADWLGQTIDAIKATNTPIDGVALHAYDGGGGVQQFLADITQQLEVIDAKGLSNVPVLLTEWNRFSGANPPDATAEANAANFVRGALKAIDRWNRTPGNHNILGTTWFVYDSGDRNNTATAPWAGYSIKYWKTAGNPYGTAGDLQTAFEQAVDQRYRAGFVGGTRPIPASIKIIDNFETGGGGAGDEGHFDKSLTFASAGSRFGFDTAASDATRDAGANYSKAWGQKIQVSWNGDSRGWQVRHVSGDSTPATNTQIPIPTDATTAALGFFLRTAAQGVSAQIVVDDNGANGGANTDAGRALNIIGDDEWHFYEWDLLKPTDWTAFPLAAGSDGVIPGGGGFVTIDSIMFYGSPTTGNATMWFDFVGVNNGGSLDVMTGVPEPASGVVLMIGFGELAMRRRRRG